MSPVCVPIAMAAMSSPLKCDSAEKTSRIPTDFVAVAAGFESLGASLPPVAGAAVLLSETDLAVPGKLLKSLKGLLMEPDRLTRMGEAARTLAHPGAAERIADQLAALARGASRGSSFRK